MRHSTDIQHKKHRLSFTALSVKLHAPRGESKSAGLPASGGAKGDRGFTLIEVMVAMSIFMILVTMGMQAVYASIAEHNQSQAVSTVMDSLNFIMEDMARNIRIGTNIHCVYPTDPIPSTWLLTPGTWYNATNFNVIPQSCVVTGSNLLFFNGIEHTSTNGDFVTYAITGPHDPTPNVVEKLKGESMANVEVVTPPEVTMDAEKSGFLVRGAEGSAAGDYSQPTVVIRLAGTINTGGTVTPFSLQTMVELRALDQ